MGLHTSRELEGYGLASAYRSLAFAAAQLHAESIVGRDIVQSHHSLLASQGVLCLKASAYDPIADIADASSSFDEFPEVSANDLNTLIESVKRGVNQTFASESFCSNGCFGIFQKVPSNSSQHIKKEPQESTKLYAMAEGIGRYWGFSVQGKLEKAFRALCLAQQDFTRLYWRHAAWRGVNLGGWFLLEPGPASPFFDHCGEKVDAISGTRIALDRSSGDTREAPEGFDDEHSVCKKLEAVGGLELKKQLFEEHRASHYTEATFDKLVTIGLNAIRLPFGYWVVQGPSGGESFDGPCLEFLDRAVNMATQKGLQVLLDLHGNPGGENDGRPCGKINPAWTWKDWRMTEAIKALEHISSRYESCESVTGVQVCNEPSPDIPADELCYFYERAIETIRSAGMSVDRVAIVLAIFPHWRIPEIMDCWHGRGNLLKYDNIVFDIHYYHDFSPLWKLFSHSQHMQVVREHACELKSLPGAIVGEWSLSRPGTFTDAEKSEFALNQVAAYNHSSHGWFFWNWHDHIFYDDWDFEHGVIGKKRIPSPIPSNIIDKPLEPQWESDSWHSVPQPKLTLGLMKCMRGLKLF